MKGGMVDQFRVGQHVKYLTNNFERVVNKNGIFERNIDVRFWTPGRIVKLHKSGRAGSAEIRPEHGGRKVTRRLQMVKGV